MNCEYLSNDKCTVLEEKCFRLDKETECSFSSHYKILVKNEGKPIADKIKREALPKVIKRWQEHAKNKKEGDKSLTGRPIQESIKKVIEEELKPFQVSIKGDKNYPVGEGVIIRPDCLIEKEKYPTTIVSVKTWLGHEQVRETFAYSLLAKNWHGQKNIRAFIVSFYPFKEKEWNKFKKSVDAFKPFLDGIYLLSCEPYIDELIQTLKDTYK